MCPCVSVHQQCLCQCLYAVSCSHKQTNKQINAVQELKPSHASGVNIPRRLCALKKLHFLSCHFHFPAGSVKVSVQRMMGAHGLLPNVVEKTHFFGGRPGRPFCLKPSRVRNDIETLLSLQQREIVGNVTSLLKSRNT